MTIGQLIFLWFLGLFIANYFTSHKDGAEGLLGGVVWTGITLIGAVLFGLVQVFIWLGQ